MDPIKSGAIFKVRNPSQLRSPQVSSGHVRPSPSSASKSSSSSSSSSSTSSTFSTPFKTAGKTPGLEIRKKFDALCQASPMPKILEGFLSTGMVIAKPSPRLPRGPFSHQTVSSLPSHSRDKMTTLSSIEDIERDTKMASKSHVVDIEVVPPPPSVPTSTSVRTALSSVRPHSKRLEEKGAKEKGINETGPPQTRSAVSDDAKKKESKEKRRENLESGGKEVRKGLVLKKGIKPDLPKLRSRTRKDAKEKDLVIDNDGDKGIENEDVVDDGGTDDSRIDERMADKAETTFSKYQRRRSSRVQEKRGRERLRRGLTKKSRTHEKSDDDGNDGDGEGEEEGDIDDMNIGRKRALRRSGLDADDDDDDDDENVGKKRGGRSKREESKTTAQSRSRKARKTVKKECIESIVDESGQKAKPTKVEYGVQSRRKKEKRGKDVFHLDQESQEVVHKKKPNSKRSETRSIKAERKSDSSDSSEIVGRKRQRRRRDPRKDISFSSPPPSRVEVVCQKTRSGRLVKPSTAYWRNQAFKIDEKSGKIVYDEGSVEMTPANDRYSFTISSPDIIIMKKRKEEEDAEDEEDGDDREDGEDEEDEEGSSLKDAENDDENDDERAKKRDRDGGGRKSKSDVIQQVEEEFGSPAILRPRRKSRVRNKRRKKMDMLEGASLEDTGSSKLGTRGDGKDAKEKIIRLLAKEGEKIVRQYDAENREDGENVDEEEWLVDMSESSSDSEIHF
eukprot:TRINITY_DN1965_c0_g1_i1.p1 TRINITY_DN1965_c0_g1~~TRINITY_DN1965_c0_g1_i1.p1  ORF type:complete len:731 (-),score=275.84 TRINITY_DN1965_c0_g1_i1:85-2277(-)